MNNMGALIFLIVMALIPGTIVLLLTGEPATAGIVAVVCFVIQKWLVTQYGSRVSALILCFGLDKEQYDALMQTEEYKVAYKYCVQYNLFWNKKRAIKTLQDFADKKAEGMAEDGRCEETIA